MSDSSQKSPLADLESRWGDERSPQLTLHLAEEHRRLGDLPRALEVLRQGLEYHPGHIAARVARGRFLLEDGQVPAGIAALESVADDDPTHLVANKLLIGAYVQVGDSKRAGNRLDLYTTLNPSDTDIEDLESRVEAITSAPAPADSTDEAPLTRGTDPPLPVEASSASASEPFGDFWSSEEQSTYPSVLAGEGIFQISESIEEETPEEETPEDDVPEAHEATVTLGNLYLDQGHFEEAESIFRTILTKQPDNADAQRGLRESQGAGQELKATDLVAPEILATVDPLQRKRLVIEGYRSRLQAASMKG